MVDETANENWSCFKRNDVHVTEREWEWASQLEEEEVEEEEREKNTHGQETSGLLSQVWVSYFKQLLETSDRGWSLKQGMREPENNVMQINIKTSVFGWLQ